MSTKVYLATKANQETIINKINALIRQDIPLGPVHYHSKKVTANGVELKWKDPADVYIQGFAAAYWQKTLIVRNDSRVPTSPTDGTVIITSTVRDQYEGTALVDATGTANSNYRAFPYATSGYLNESEDNVFRGYTLFGFVIDESNSSPTASVTYTDDNVDFAPIRMNFDTDTIGKLVNGEIVSGNSDWMSAFFMPRPCMLHRADADHAESYVDYYLDPNDYTKKLDGTTSDVANTAYTGNAMMEWPAVFFKVKKNGPKISFKICDIRLDEEFEAWSAKRSDGTYAKWYTPIYEGSVISSVMRSMSTNALPTNNTSASNELSYSKANNINEDKGYATTLWADEQIIKILGWMVTRSLDVQSAIGGVYNTASSLQIKCGGGNAKGLFYGKNDGSYTTTKFFGMENWWGHRWRRCQGINILDYRILTKMTLSNIDGSTGEIVASDNSVDYAGYINTEDIVPAGASQSYITEINYGPHSACMPLVASGGGSAAYYCDAIWSSSGLRGVMFGGHVLNGLNSGLSASGVNNAPSVAYWNCGASLSYHHF